jgi:hypothetical protein
MIRPETFFEALTRNPSLYDVIFSCLHPGQRVQLKRVDKAASAAIDHFHRRAHNVNSFLKQYFEDSIAFRSLQARTGAVVSGSAVLQILDQTVYPDSDLDIYVELCMGGCQVD